MMQEPIEVVGKWRDAAMQKPAWQRAKAIERNERRAWKVVDDPDEIGAWGEAALCQLLGVDPMVEMFKDDPTEPDVCGVEVRTTTHPNGHLIIRQTKATADHVLAIVSPERRFVRLVGWISPEEINNDDRFPFRTDRGHPPARWIPGAVLDQDIGALCVRVYQRRFEISI